jgi:hypothetical protein
MAQRTSPRVDPLVWDLRSNRRRLQAFLSTLLLACACYASCSHISSSKRPPLKQPKHIDKGPRGTFQEPPHRPLRGSRNQHVFTKCGVRGS